MYDAQDAQRCHAHLGAQEAYSELRTCTPTTIARKLAASTTTPRARLAGRRASQLDRAPSGSSGCHWRGLDPTITLASESTLEISRLAVLLAIEL